MSTADVAVIGGTGFYSFLEDAEEHAVTTPYGDPSAPVAVGTVAGRRVAFLPRHGRHHDFPPHLINYRANLWALRSLGVRQVLAPCAVGGLSPQVAPGDLVVPDQLVDRTSGRVSSYVERGAVHLPFADPYCPRVSDALVAAAPDVRRGGTMVVIDGPRFSTRAESQWYAAQGGTLINMTGAPEAALARELRMCYAALALVTDMDAGVEGESGVGQEEVFALFRSNLERLTGLLATAVGGAAGPRGLLLLDLGRRHRAHLRRARGGGPVRVLLTGSAGFIGTAVGEVLEEDGHEVVRVDLMLPMAHGAAEPPAGTHHLDVRDAGAWVDLLRGVDAVCHQAAVVGAGVRVGDLPDVRRPQRPRHRRAAGRDARGGRRPAGAGLLDGGLRRGPLPVSRARRPDAPAPGGRRARRRATSTTTARAAHSRWTGRWSRRTRGSTRARRTPPARSPRSTTPPRGCARRARERWRCATTTSTARGCRGTRRTPVWRRLFRSSLERGEPPQVFEDGGQARDFVHVADVARANLAALRAVTDDATPAYAAYNVASGHPVRILDVATLVARGTGRTIAPVVTGGYRLGDVRHVVASPARAAAELGFSAEVLPEQGLPAFATAPLRRRPQRGTDHQAV